MLINDSTRRFSSRVGNYIKYRPGYPYEIIETLRIECGLTVGTRPHILICVQTDG